MADTYTVYKHTAPSGKSYIGITSLPLAERIKRGYPHNQYMTAAIEKYGWDNIETEIIADGVDIDTANLLETYYIASFETQDHANGGYNIADGGLSWNSQSEEVRKKLSEAAHNRHTPIAPATRKKISENMPTNKPVQCVETGEVFRCISEAGRQTGTNRKSISKCCNGQRHTAGKLHWRFVDVSGSKTI